MTLSQSALLFCFYTKFWTVPLGSKMAGHTMHKIATFTSTFSKLEQPSKWSILLWVEWVSSFLRAQQHRQGYSVPIRDWQGLQIKKYLTAAALILQYQLQVDKVCDHTTKSLFANRKIMWSWEPGKSYHWLVYGDCDRQRTRPTNQEDQGGSIHPERRTTSQKQRRGQLPTQPRIWPLSWHGYLLSCQEPKELKHASSDEGLW